MGSAGGAGDPVKDSRGPCPVISQHLSVLRPPILNYDPENWPFIYLLCGTHEKAEAQGACVP